MQRIQKMLAFVGMVVAGNLAVGMGAALLGPWWAEATSKTGQAQAAPVIDGEVSEREALIRGIIWVQATLPRKVDDRTTLVAVGLNGRTYWKRLVLDADSGEINSNTKAALQREATEDICKRRGLRSTNDTIAVYHVEYVDRRRNPIQTFEITKSDCL